MYQICMSVFLCVSVCVTSMPSAHGGQKLSRTGVKNDCETPRGHWKHRVSTRATSALNG